MPKTYSKRANSGKQPESEPSLGKQTLQNGSNIPSTTRTIIYLPMDLNPIPPQSTVHSERTSLIKEKDCNSNIHFPSQAVNQNRTTSGILDTVTTPRACAPPKLVDQTPPKTGRRVKKNTTPNTSLLQHLKTPIPPQSTQKVRFCSPLEQQAMVSSQATIVKKAKEITLQPQDVTPFKSALKLKVKDTTTCVSPQQASAPTPSKSRRKVTVPSSLPQQTMVLTRATSVKKAKLASHRPQQVMVANPSKSARKLNVKDVASCNSLPQQESAPTRSKSKQKVTVPLPQQTMVLTRATTVKKAKVTTPQPQETMVSPLSKSARKEKDTTSRTPQMVKVPPPQKSRRKVKCHTPLPQQPMGSVLSNSGQTVKDSSVRSPLLRQTVVSTTPKPGLKVTNPQPEQAMVPTLAISVKKAKLTSFQPQKVVVSAPSKSAQKEKDTTSYTSSPLLQQVIIPTTLKSRQRATFHASLPQQAMSSVSSTSGWKVKDCRVRSPLLPQAMVPSPPKSGQKVINPQPQKVMDSTPSKSGRKVKNTSSRTPLIQQEMIATSSKSGQKVTNPQPQQAMVPTPAISVKKAKLTSLQPQEVVVSAPSKSEQKVISPHPQPQTRGPKAGRIVKESTVRHFQLQLTKVPTPPKSECEVSPRKPLSQLPIDSTPGKKSKTLREKKTTKHKSKPVLILSTEENDSESNSLHTKLSASCSENDHLLEKNSQIVRGETFIVAGNSEHVCLPQGKTASSRPKTNSASAKFNRKVETLTGSICPPGQTTPLTTMRKTSKQCKKNEDLESPSTFCGEAVKRCKVGIDQMVINTPVVCSITSSLVGNTDEILFPQGGTIADPPLAPTSTKSIRKCKSRTPASTTKPKSTRKNLQDNETSKSGKVVQYCGVDKDPLAVAVFPDSKLPERDETINNCRLDGIPPQIDALVSQILDPEDTKSKTVEKLSDTDKEVKEVNRRTRIRISSIPPFQTVEFVHQDETESRQLSSIRKPIGITPSGSSELPKWDIMSELKLLGMLRENGFDGNFKELAPHFPGHSDNSLRYFFSTIREGNKIIEDKCKVANGCRKLIKLIRDDQESQSVGINIPLFLEFYAIFGHHPDPSQTGEVDYPAILRCVASLARGHIPKELNSSSAAKLDSIIELLLKNLSLRDGLPPITEGMQMPTKKNPISLKERNVILARRRSTCWSEEEIAAREDVLSRDLATVRKRYLSLACFNPFKFPPE